jgi:hypothetical protein
MQLRRIPFAVVTLLAAAAFLIPAPGALAATAQDGPVTGSAWSGTDRTWLPQARASVPEDRYAMAGGCYGIRAADGGYVVRGGKTFAASAADLASAEPFHFQATDLGSYLLFGTAEDFLASTEGTLGHAANTATESLPGQIAGGLSMEQTDAAADEVARSDANEATGRGSGIVQAAAPSELADWVIEEAGDGTFELRLPATEQALAVGNGKALDLVPEADADRFAFELTSGCAVYPEVEINVDGPVVGGETGFQEVRGYVDAHLHMMAYEFLGGRARCGRPWHPYGVAYALVDCPDHEPGGRGAVLEQVLTRETPGTEHDTSGWPSFTGWPTHSSLTHEQVYYKWLERAWRGGLRMFTNLLVDNNQLCKIYPYKRNSCNEMDGVRLQARRIRELERYIDAQSGGPGEGWFRIVTDPFEARRVINEGKLAVVLGIEVSVPLDCGTTLDVPRCDAAAIDAGLDEVWDLGVRQMELVNKFDNALSGVAGDSGDTGVVVNQGNKGETGQYWQMETCTEADGHAHDKTQRNFHDESGAPDEFSGRDGLAGGIFGIFGTSGVAPIYPEGPHCNVRGLTPLGEKVIRDMAARGMIFDPDHMSARAQTQALNLVESLGYSGVISSHSWSNDTIYPRILKLGGMVTPYAGGSSGFVNDRAKTRAWADDRFYFGIGYGSDMNGFGSQGGPRLGADNPVQYPFTGLGGATVDQQRSGTRTYDINADGVAHYGLYPDWIEDLRRIAGDGIVEDMARGAEAYLQMWERATGIAPDACRPDVADLTEDSLRALSGGMSPRDVLTTLGQPGSRQANVFTYCMDAGRTARLTFGSDGTLLTWKYPKRPPV